MHNRLVLILLLLAAHVIADRYLRPGNGIKGRSLHSYLLLHSLIHFIVSLLLTIVIISYQVFIVVLIIAASHYLIDLVKTKFLRKIITNGTVVDAIDQFAHIVFIVMVAVLFGV